MESNPQLVHHLLLMIVALFQRPGAGHRHAFLLQLIRTDDQVLSRFPWLRVLRRRRRHRHVTAVVLQIRELGWRNVLDVVSLGSLRVQVSANVVGHLSVLLSLLRAIVLVALVALIVHTGEN